MGDWRFDLTSAIIGALLSLVTAWAVYRQRETLASLRDGVINGARRIKVRITAGVEDRYRERVAAWAARVGPLSHQVPLHDVFVISPLEMPLLHPHPEQKRSARRDGYTWPEALGGHPRLALLGEPGSGRTALLAYLARVAALQTAPESLGLPAGYLPVYIDLRAIDWSAPAEELLEDETAGKERRARPPEPVDSLEQLIKAGLAAVGAPETQAVALGQRLTGGTALVLVDGWDELEPAQRERATDWLASLIDRPGNLWLVAGPVRGFALLTRIGLVPLRLAPWRLADAQTLLDRWIEAFPLPEGQEPVELERLRADLPRLLRYGADPIELSLRCWFLVAGQEIPDSRGDLFVAAVDRMLEPPKKKDEPAWSLQMVHDVVSALALKLQQERRDTITRQEILDELEIALPAMEERPAHIEEQIVLALSTPPGPLRPRGERSFVFVHPLFQACLAARQALPLAVEMLLERLQDPHWETVIDFYATWGAMEPLVEAWVRRPDDLWYTRLRRTTRWVAATSSGAKWRNGIMALLARALLGPALQAPIRRLLADALVQTGDPGVTYFLRQAASHANPDVRAAVLHALGHVAGEAELSVLEAALADPEPAVQEAAIAALGKMGDRAAAHTLTHLLITAEQDVRVLAAQALAHCGEEGWEILLEALREDDFFTRRAAVYGMGEVERPERREILLRVAREDSEWIVRSAAETVIDAEDARFQPLEPPLQISDAGWLITWAAQRGESVGVGEAAFPTLLSVLDEGSAALREAATQALGLVGRPEHVDVLQRVLGDDDPARVADALQALYEVARRYDLVIRV